jgi:hypothetical protein
VPAEHLGAQQWEETMGRHKPQRPRPSSNTHSTNSKPRPQGEQQLSNTVWAQIVKAIRALDHAPA